jgi:methionyl-tRNA synthetase
LLRETVFGQDGNFSYDALVTRYNADLANGLGNLASRTLTMIEKYFGGKIPEGGDSLDPSIQQIAESVVAGNAETPGVPWSFDRFHFSQALTAIWTLISAVDAYLTTNQPWVLAEDETKRARLAAVLYTAAEALRFVAVLAHPVLPDSTTKLWKQLGQSGPLGEQRIDALRWGQLKPGTQLGKPQTLFPRIEKAEAIERMEAMENESQKPITVPAAPAASATSSGSAAAAQAAPEKIAIEDFAKVEMRVGEIKTAERIAGADKLLKLTVDIGTEIRQICAGIAQYYEPEKLVGRKVAVVVNLAPRKLRGVESNGMIIAAAVGPEGRPVLAGFLEDVEVGARLK